MEHRLEMTIEQMVNALNNQIKFKDYEIERLRKGLLEIFDYECRNNDKSLIVCTAREALWPYQKGQ